VTILNTQQIQGADVNPDKNAYYNGMNLERPNQQGTRLTLQNFLTPGLN
jgi:hypothetical protein